MLSLITPLRGLVALFVVTLVIVAWPRVDPPDWQVGYVQRGSLRVVDGGYAFTLVRNVGSRCADHQLDVVFEGALTNTVCEGADVMISGTLFSHRRFEAAEVHGFNDGRYDRCWRLRCDRDAYARCRGTLFE